MKDPKELWFNTPDSPTLCRGGGNGPNHPSQLYAIKKYAKDGMSILDIGCGSGCTIEAIKGSGVDLLYKGVDMIPKNVEHCRKMFPEDIFQVEDGENLDEDDRSYDIVYSRHVVDHMPSFEKALDEHKRCSNRYVFVILWVPFSTGDEHEIKNIDYRPSGGKLYPTEYTNQYSRKKVMKYLTSDPEWNLLECTEEVGVEVSGHDVVICLERK